MVSLRFLLIYHSPTNLHGLTVLYVLSCGLLSSFELEVDIFMGEHQTVLHVLSHIIQRVHIG